MIENFEAKYMAAVPGCCRLRTFEAHREIMLCWSVAAVARNDAEQTNCGLCEFNAEPAGDFARIEWETKNAKERMWNTLKGRRNEYI